MITNNFTQPRIMIVGDMPDAMEAYRGTMHTSDTLAGMLHEVGILLTECSLANVLDIPSPTGKVEYFFTDAKATKMGLEAYAGQEALVPKVLAARPTIILALGPLACQALTGKASVSKWRGSTLTTLPMFGNIKVVPTFSSAMIDRMWAWRPIAVRDIKRTFDESTFPEVRRDPWQFTIRPSYSTVVAILDDLFGRVTSAPTRLSVDIETRGGFIACIGVAWNKLEALCIPLMSIGSPGNNYWSAHEENDIILRLRALFTHPNARIIGQNFAYDAQYFAVQCGFLPIVALDTMLMQHTLYAGMKKSLDFIASMYCERYVYWKDDGKEWNPKIPEEQYWSYNCEDCVRTFECSEVLERLLDSNGLTEQYAFLSRMWPKVVRTMLRGVRIDEKRKNNIALELMGFLDRIQGEVFTILGHPINLASPQQLMRLFYDDFQMKVVRDKKTKKPTTNDDALKLFKKREPLLTGLVDRISAVRSAAVLLSTFALMPLDTDRRMRCYYNLAGTETYRLNSSKNAFGSGGNLQNLTAGPDEKDTARILAQISKGHVALIPPNLKLMFVPDPGMMFFDVDLDRADLMIVIWEANDEQLRAAVAAGIDLHRYNASALFGIPEDRITYSQRQSAKVFCHGTNYGGSARTMAINCGLTVHQSETMQRRWFGTHPGILEWHRRTEAQLQASSEVRNIFGYRRRYFDRPDSILPEALAWVPQSTVAIVINKGWEQLAIRAPEVEVLLQVHDSLAGQFPIVRANPIMRTMRECMEIPLPYEIPLTIGVGISTSLSSWGECEPRDWPSAPRLILPETHNALIRY